MCAKLLTECSKTKFEWFRLKHFQYWSLPPVVFETSWNIDLWKLLNLYIEKKVFYSLTWLFIQKLSLWVIQD